MNILIFNEGIHDKEPSVKAVYPTGLHGVLKEILEQDGHTVKTVTLEDENCGISKEVLDQTDVLLWWGHMAHKKVPDEVAALVQNAVLEGMGFIALHSAHMSKPFRRLMGTSCTLKWRDGARERLWTVAPSHPIAEGIPEQFLLEKEEMYGEFFDVPEPDETVFIGWFNGGEVFRSGLTYHRGHGKIFYFQPGHETNASFQNEYVRRIIRNAVHWAKPAKRVEITCPQFMPLEKI